MVVMILERVPRGLRGELSRWMIEPRPGLFVGTVSALVRDRLWDRVAEELDEVGDGGAILIHGARTEQGFRVVSLGTPQRQVVDWEGLTLIRVEEPSGRAPARSRRRRADPAEAPPKHVGAESGDSER